MKKIIEDLNSSQIDQNLARAEYDNILPYLGWVLYDLANDAIAVTPTLFGGVSGRDGEGGGRNVRAEQRGLSDWWSTASSSSSPTPTTTASFVMNEQIDGTNFTPVGGAMMTPSLATAIVAQVQLIIADDEQPFW